MSALLLVLAMLMMCKYAAVLIGLKARQELLVLLMPLP